jgi:hypothetical protein
MKEMTKLAIGAGVGIAALAGIGYFVSAWLLTSPTPTATATTPATPAAPAATPTTTTAAGAAST